MYVLLRRVHQRRHRRIGRHCDVSSVTTVDHGVDVQLRPRVQRRPTSAIWTCRPLHCQWNTCSTCQCSSKPTRSTAPSTIETTCCPLEYGGGPRSTEPPRSTGTSVGALAPTSTSTLRSASPRAATSCGVTRGRAAQCDEGGQHCTRPAVTLVTCDTRITPNTRLSAPRAGRPRVASHRAASTRVMAGSRLRDLRPR